MPRETKKEMEERFELVLRNLNKAHILEKEQINAYWDKEALEYELKIAQLQGQIEVYREVLGLEREHIIEGMQDANKQ